MHVDRVRIEMPILFLRGHRYKFLNLTISVPDDCFCLKVCKQCILFVLLLYVPSQQLWSWWDGQFT